jgi:hypothetical protein
MYVTGARAAYPAVTIVLAAGMAKVVVEAVELATLAPDQLWNCCPEGAALATMVTTFPAANDALLLPFAVPLITVSV